MCVVSSTIVGCALALFAVTAQPKVSPDPALAALKERLEQEFQKLDPKPTFDFPGEGYQGRTLIVRYKTRKYVVHTELPKGGYAETTERREGPDDGGFLLTVHMERLGEVNQLVVPWVIRQPYWDLYVNVYPVKNTKKQLYVGLDYLFTTDKKLLDRIKKVAKELDLAEKKKEAEKKDEPEKKK